MKTLKEALFSRKNIKSNPYGLTKADLKDDIKYVPMGVVVRMLEEQERQGNTPDIKVFQRFWAAGQHRRGFDWEHTEAEGIFWELVLHKKNWDMFFERYPDYKKYNLD